MNNTGWVMHKIKISDIDPYLLTKQTPPGHTHFMAPFTNRSIGDFEQAVIIKKNALRPGNEEVKYPHGMLEYVRERPNKKIPQYITYYNNAGVGILRQLIEHEVENADVALKPGGKRKSRKNKEIQEIQENQEKYKNIKI